MSERTPRVTQFGMCTPDFPSTMKRFVEVFGFVDAGAGPLWGDWLAAIQDAGEEVICTIGWLCSRQSLFQLEFFEHKVPDTKPLAANRAPSDVGWTRIGIAVPDFDETLERLSGLGIETITEPQCFDGFRRVCYRDPDLGSIIEIIEEGGAGPAQERVFDVDPGVVYATLSLRDFAEGRRFLAEVIALPELDPASLHAEEMESLWGLDGASRQIAVFDGGAISIELVSYSDPRPTALPAEAQIIDHGVSHIAFGFRERADLDRLVGRLEADGRQFTIPLPDPPSSTYVYGPERVPIEVLSIPQERDQDFGFAPVEFALRPREKR